MKLYGEHNPAPNPRRVRIFLAEKGIEVEHVHIPMRQGAHKTPDFLTKNSLGQVPVLELDDGTCLRARLLVAADGERPAGVWPLDPHRLRQLGVAHVPEDRHRLGLVLDFEALSGAGGGADGATSVACASTSTACSIGGATGGASTTGTVSTADGAGRAASTSC